MTFSWRIWAWTSSTAPRFSSSFANLFGAMRARLANTATRAWNSSGVTRRPSWSAILRKMKLSLTRSLALRSARLEILFLLLDLLLAGPLAHHVADDVINDVLVSAATMIRATRSPPVPGCPAPLAADALLLVLVEFVLQIAFDPLAEFLHVLRFPRLGERVVEFRQHAPFDLENLHGVNALLARQLLRRKVRRQRDLDLPLLARLGADKLGAEARNERLRRHFDPERLVLGEALGLGNNFRNRLALASPGVIHHRDQAFFDGARHRLVAAALLPQSLDGARDVRLGDQRDLAARGQAAVVGHLESGAVSSLTMNW